MNKNAISKPLRHECGGTIVFIKVSILIIIYN